MRTSKTYSRSHFQSCDIVNCGAGAARPTPPHPSARGSASSAASSPPAPALLTPACSAHRGTCLYGLRGLRTHIRVGAPASIFVRHGHQCDALRERPWCQKRQDFLLSCGIFHCPTRSRVLSIRPSVDTRLVSGPAPVSMGCRRRWTTGFPFLRMSTQARGCPGPDGGSSSQFSGKLQAVSHSGCPRVCSPAVLQGPVSEPWPTPVPLSAS